VNGPGHTILEVALNSEMSVALDLYKASTGYAYTLWNFYSAVVVAVVGLVYGGRTKLNGRAKVALAIAFTVLALANVIALRQAQELRIAAANVIRASSPELKGTDKLRTIGECRTLPVYQCMLSEIDPPRPLQVTLFHVALTVGVLVSIYAAHKWDVKDVTAPKTG
jgi:hypothetical protein